jgi:hypothetical protein
MCLMMISVIFMCCFNFLCITIMMVLLLRWIRVDRLSGCKPFKFSKILMRIRFIRELNETKIITI